MAGKIRHLKVRNGRYSARLIVPIHLRSIIGKTELEIQLGGDRKVALTRLPGALASLQGKIGVAEHQATAGNPVTARYPMTNDEIAFANYQSLVAFDTELRAQDPRFANMEMDDGLLADLRAGMAGRLGDEELDNLVGYRIDRFRHRGNTGAVKGSFEWRNLAIALCVSEYEALARKAERDEGHFSGKPEHPLIANAKPIELPAPPVYLRSLLDRYLKQLEQGGKGAAARKRWTPVFEDLAIFVGHNDASRITKRNMIDWRDAKLEKLSPRTVSNVYFASVKAVFAWAVLNDYLPANPSEGVKVKKTRQMQSREKGFRDDEAASILKACRAYVPTPQANPANREAWQTTAAKRWSSLLCAFTGARIVEITQLRKQDVRDEAGTTVIRLSPDAGSIKTGQYRDVPLHPQIIEQGFLDFLAGAPDGPLFHTAPKDKALQGARTTSGRISNWLQSLGVIPEGVSPSHGWRHRFKTIGQEVEISDRVVDAIQGHAGRTAGDNYGDVTILTKKKAIARLPAYPLD